MLNEGRSMEKPLVILDSRSDNMDQKGRKWTLQPRNTVYEFTHELINLSNIMPQIEIRLPQHCQAQLLALQPNPSNFFLAE